jgi:hypothetical protein
MMTTPKWRKSTLPGLGLSALTPPLIYAVGEHCHGYPFPGDLSLDTALFYTILFNNGISMSIPLLEIADIIPKPPVDIATSNSQDSLLPPFLGLNSKITYEHNRTYHNGYLGLQDGVYWFVSNLM